MKKILVVDDEEDILFLIQKTLEMSGLYNVVSTSDPKEVLTLCQRECPDLILLDIVMPDIDGQDLIKSIKKDPETANTLIVVTSGLGEMVYFKRKDEWKWQPNRPVIKHRKDDVIKEKSAERAAQAYGVDDFLSKPFSASMLLEVVEEVLKRAGS